MTASKAEIEAQLRNPNFLRNLRLQGKWYEGCGWTWGGLITTKRLLDSLTQKGFVKIDRIPPTETKKEILIYTLTEQAADLLAKLDTIISGERKF